MPWWSLNIESILQGGWLLLLQRMRSGRANSASHINMMFLRYSCNLPSCKYIFLHLSDSFPKSEWKIIFLFSLSEENVIVISPQHFPGKYYGFLLCSLVLAVELRQQGNIWAECWVPAELSRSEEPGAAAFSEREKIPPIWEAETLACRRGWIFSLVTDRGSWVTAPLVTLPQPSSWDLARSTTPQSSARCNGPYSEAGRRADLEPTASHSLQKRSQEKGSFRAPPGTLHGAPLWGEAEPSQGSGSASCLIASSSGQRCISTNHFFQGLSRHAAHKHHLSRAGRVSVFFSFPWATRLEPREHHPFMLL